MRLLVTGGAGFIGSNFVRYWVGPPPRRRRRGLRRAHLRRQPAQPGRRRGPDRLRPGRHRRPGRRWRNTLAEHQIDVIVNFAAESHNSLAILDPTRFFQTNVLGTQTLAEAARRHGVSRFHHISTCEVYGDLPLDSDEVFTEETPYRPRTPYNASKAGADHAVRAYVRDLRAAGHHHQLLQQLRALPVPREGHPAVHGQGPRRPAPAAVRLDPEPPGVAARGRPLPGHRAGAPARRGGGDLQRGQRGEASIEEIADAVLAATGKPQSLKEIVPDRPSHDRRYLLDSTKIRKALGWEPTIGFEEGLAATVHVVRRAPQLVGAAARPGPGGRGRLDDRPPPDPADVTDPVRVLVTGATASSAGTSAMSWPAVPRRGRLALGRGRRCRPGGRAAGASSVLSTDIDTLDLVDRTAVRRRLRRRSVPTSSSTAGPSPRSTPVSPTPTPPSPSTPWAPATWPRPRAVGAHLVYVSTDYVFDGRSTGPTSSGTRPARARSTAAASWPARSRWHRPAVGCHHRAHGLGQRRPRRQHGQDRAPAGGREPTAGRSASSTTSTGPPPSPPTWPRPSSAWPSTGVPGRST